MGPRVLVVTDRRRLLARLGAGGDDWETPLVALVAGAVRGGADLVQVRERDVAAGRLVAFLRRLFTEVPQTRDRVVVNDRVDVAVVSGAAGVHLTERSVGVTEARALAPAGRRWVVGRSVHGPETAQTVRQASYVVAGAVLATVSKPDLVAPLGWRGLAAIAEAVAPVPVVAIGGLGRADAAAVRRAGATGIAGIGCFLPDAGEDVEAGVAARVRAMRQAIDTSEGET